MSIIPSPSSRHMRNNTFFVLKSSLKAYHERTRENFACGLDLLVHFQIGLGFTFEPRSGGAAQ